MDELIVEDGQNRGAGRAERGVAGRIGQQENDGLVGFLEKITIGTFKETSTFHEYILAGRIGRVAGRDGNVSNRCWRRRLVRLAIGKHQLAEYINTVG